MGVDATQILVLNYNGRALLEECLPSIVLASNRSPVPCRVAVVDNGSTDDSLDFLRDQWPELTLIREPNRGLASFNAVLSRLTEPVVLLLNNDVKLGPDAVGPLLRPFEREADALFAAPQCWTFDGEHYEGMRTRVRTRFGIIQGLCRVPGHEACAGLPDLTASSGPVLAVDRVRFLDLGGYDPIYFPGRIEDIDLGFRGWMAGYRGYYEPESIAYHKGFGSFGPAFGPEGCDRLAARNSLLFAWKNLVGLRLLNHLAWLPARMLSRSGYAIAFIEAARRLGAVWAARRGLAVGRGEYLDRQEAFFERFRF